MTSRTFKPSSFCLRPQRPSYTRSSSNSSVHSVRSQNQERPSSSCSAQSEVSDTTPVREPSNSNNVNAFSERRPSRPIAIELPTRRKGSTQINSPTPPAPLSGRGEKLGGYFPFHDDNNLHSTYKAHPFHYEPVSEDLHPRNGLSGERSPLCLKAFNSSAHTTAAPTSATPVMDHLAAMSPSMELGKYHPSNYKGNPKTKTPTMERAHTDTQSHKRQASDVRKKIHQYQRDIMEQAALAAGISIPGQYSPEGPKLAPLGSPGPVTPFELEESDGYLVAGLSSAGRVGDHNEVIGKLIEQEKARKVGGLSSSTNAPLSSPLRSPVVSPIR